MAWRFAHFLLVVPAGLLVTALPAVAEDSNDIQVKAIKAAVKRVAPTVVQINTIGGTDRVVVGARGTQIRKAMGPTTGVIIGADGYIVSSAFNFVNRPNTILVSIPGHPKPYPAKVVATDESRMLTLLKVKATGLPVPAATPKKEMQVGQWSIALGRTLDPSTADLPAMSVGIISALNRIWGKAVQIDAKVSPVNYGGPAVDVFGRVQGILVPASPQGDNSTAGIEWYDSGIGFAVPLEDINRVLPRLKKGENLKRGLIGVGLPNPYDYGAKPVVGTVMVNSPAMRAGIKPGDQIVEIEGKRIERVAQLQHLIGGKYEGDTVSLKVLRAGKEITLNNLKLVSTAASFDPGFLGILPMRDDPELGVQVRYIYPKSPAAKAGLKAGDRVMKFGLDRGRMIALNGQRPGREQLKDFLKQLPPLTRIRLEVVRKGGKKTETLRAALDSMADGAVSLVPESLPEDVLEASFKKALDPRVTLDARGKPVRPKAAPKKKKGADSSNGPQTGLIKQLSATGDHTYYIYVPDNYDPNVAHGVLVWLHPPGKFKKDNVEEFTNTWDDFCNDNHVILVCPVTEQKSGWLPTESEFVLGVVREVLGRYTVDRQRVVAHGMGQGGQMAFYLAFQARDLFRAIATTGTVFTREPKDNVANQPLCFFVVAGDKDPLAKAIAASQRKIARHKFPVVYREIKNMGAQYLDEPTLKEMARWVDSLDRM
jgi:S1-C subfamily serine protease/predicted esterase